MSEYPAHHVKLARVTLEVQVAAEMAEQMHIKRDSELLQEYVADVLRSEFLPTIGPPSGFGNRNCALATIFGFDELVSVLLHIYIDQSR